MIVAIKMIEKFNVFQALCLFIKQVKELCHDPTIVNYNVLLGKITQSKTAAIDVQYNSVVEFLEKSKSVLTTVPLALNCYTIHWYPLQKLESSKSIKIDLLPAFTSATSNQAVILHCHILKMASLVYRDEPEFASVLAQLESTVEMPVDGDAERKIIDSLFSAVKEVDVQAFDQNDPEKFITTVMSEKMSSLLPMFKQPGLKYKQLFAYLFQDIEKIGKEKGISDPHIDELLSSLKESDYEITKIAPKIFSLCRTMLGDKGMQSLRSFIPQSESNMTMMLNQVDENN